MSPVQETIRPSTTARGASARSAVAAPPVFTLPFIALLVGLALVLAGVLPTLFVRGRFFVPYGLVMFLLGLAALLPAAVVNYTPHLPTLFRREFGSFFLSPIAYLTLIGMTVVGALNFFLFVALVLRGPQAMFTGVTFPVRQFWLGWELLLCITLVVPVITMRLFSEERRSGTIEVLLTAPLTETEVVLSKFLSALVFYMILWVPWGLFLAGLYFFGQAKFDFGPVISFYIGLLLTGTTFISAGVFFSSLTRNQIIAAILTFAIMLLLLALVLLVEILTDRGLPQQVVDVFRYVSYWAQLWDFASGKVDLRYVVLHLSAGTYFLFLTTKMLEAQKWR